MVYCFTYCYSSSSFLFNEKIISIEPEVLDIAWRIRSAAREHRSSPSSLGGWCAICSYHIFKKLRSIGKRSYFVVINKEGKGSHCFVLYKKFIIDVTATQFSHVKEAVIIEDVENLQHPNQWYWNKSLMTKINRTSAIKEALANWPSDQDPFRFDFSC